MAPRMDAMERPRGFTLLELIAVVAMVAALFALAAFQSRRLEAQQERAAFFTSLERLFWQAATASASRGRPLRLVRTGEVLRVETLDAPPKTLLRLEIPEGVTVDLPEGTLATFTPPGRVHFAPSFPKTCGGPSFAAALPEGLRRCYRISLIGEVEVQYR